MKILISPSKTRNKKFDDLLYIEQSLPLYTEKANYIAEEIKKKSINELSKIMKIKDSLLDNTYENYLRFNELEAYPAIQSYTGTVFNEIQISRYDSFQMDYMNKNLRILSALYGVLKPYDSIKDYRLDMNTKVLEISNYEFWENSINKKAIDLIDDEIVLNLSSNEFSKMVKFPYINVEFKESTGDSKYKTVGVYSKKARGQMVNFLVTNRIESIDEVKRFSEDNYSYNEILSNETNIVFTR